MLEIELPWTMVWNSDNAQVLADNANDDTAEDTDINLSTSLVDAEADKVDKDVDEGLAGGTTSMGGTVTDETVKVGKVKRKVKKIGSTHLR